MVCFLFLSIFMSLFSCSYSLPFLLTSTLSISLTHFSSFHLILFIPFFVIFLPFFHLFFPSSSPLVLLFMLRIRASERVFSSTFTLSLLSLLRTRLLCFGCWCVYVRVRGCETIISKTHMKKKTQSSNGAEAKPREEGKLSACVSKMIKSSSVFLFPRRSRVRNMTLTSEENNNSERNEGNCVMCCANYVAFQSAMFPPVALCWMSVFID